MKTFKIGDRVRVSDGRVFTVNDPSTCWVDDVIKIGEAPRFCEGDKIIDDGGSIGIIRAVVGQLMFPDWGSGCSGYGYTQECADQDCWKLYEEPKTEHKMIEIKGKKWSEDTIAEALRKHAE